MWNRPCTIYGSFLGLVFNSEQQAVYNCEANDVDMGVHIMNRGIVYVCQVLVEKSLSYIVKLLN